MSRSRNLILKTPVTVTSPPTVDEIKRAVVGLAGGAKQSVVTVREAFTAGIAPYQVAGSGSVSSYISSITSDPLSSKIIQSTSRLGLSTSTAGSSVPPPKPDISSAEIFESRGGSLDAFCVKLTVALSLKERDGVDHVRIMRAKEGPVTGAPRPTISALMSAPEIPGKNLDSIFSAQKMIDEIGVGNNLVRFISDGISGKSVSSPESRKINPTVPPLNTNTSSSSGLVSIAGVDRSVLEDLNFYLNRRSVGDVPVVPVLSPPVFDKIGINVLQGSTVSPTSTGVVQAPNTMDFAEISRVDLSGPGSRQVGDLVEIDVVDKAVVYGSSFVYYAVCVGKDGGLGTRSRLVKVNVLRHVPPKVPEVTFSVIGRNPRFLIRCSPGTDHVEIFRTGRSVEQTRLLGGENSVVSQGTSTKVGQYWHISDVGLGPDGSTTFVDTSAVPGDSMSYRIYSVDPYGLKCQTPFSCSIRMPEDGRQIPLAVPSVVVEQAPGVPAIKIGIKVDDERITGFILQRRDVTIGERAVHQPNQPEYVDLGLFSSKRAGSRRGPQMRDVDWPLYIPASAGSASYIDSDVTLDRIYQYAVGAIDKRGNRTSMVGSNPVGVYVKSLIDAPTALSASVSFDSGVLVTWSPGTHDFSPNSLLDDQDVLAATAVRSVFQVERRRIGSPFWDAMPATSESYFLDKIGMDQNPPFRPAFARPGEEYEYRVVAMQSGGFASPKTDSIRVSVTPPPSPPSSLFVRATPVEVSPTVIVLSWDMSGDFIERWDVERASVNRLYASQVSSPEDLDYERVSEITPEASRARALTADSNRFDRDLFAGNRGYVDHDLDLANSYFYRVRTQSGATSEWRYVGITLRDPSFDRKFFSALSDERKVELSRTPQQIDSRLIRRRS